MKKNQFAMAGFLFFFTMVIVLVGLGLINLPSVVWKYGVQLIPEYKIIDSVVQTTHNYMNQDVVIIGKFAVGSGLALMFVLFFMVASSNKLTLEERLLKESKEMDSINNDEVEKNIPDRF